MSLRRLKTVSGLLKEHFIISNTLLFDTINNQLSAKICFYDIFIFLYNKILPTVTM